MKEQRLCRWVAAAAAMKAKEHQPDERRGGCTCGFCAWSVEHVVIMSIREGWALAVAQSHREILRDSCLYPLGGHGGQVPCGEARAAHDALDHQFRSEVGQ